jgi:hypothetical protein
MKKKVLVTCVMLIGILGLKAQEKNFNDFIAPVSNPIYFESPFHTTELRLIHIHQRLHKEVNSDVGKLKLGGTLDLTALQIRYAVMIALVLLRLRMVMGA